MRGSRGVVAAVAAMAMLAGCGGGDGDELVVYSSFALPGAGDTVRAQQLALGEAGGRAGKFRIRLEPLSNTKPEISFADPERAAANARRAVGDDRAIAYIGEGPSDSTAASLPVLNRAGMLMVAPYSTYVGLTQREGALPGEPQKYYPTGRRTLGRIIPADHIQAAAIVEYMRREDVGEAAIIHDSSIYGKGLARLVAGRTPGSGVRLGGPPRGFRTGGDGRQYGEADEEVRRAAERGADAVVVAANIPEGLLPRLARAAPRVTFFLPDSAAPSVASAEIEDRLRFTTPRTGQPEAARAFAKTFKNRFGEDPDPLAIYAYESVKAIIAAVERAGDQGDDRGAVVRAFFALGKRDTPLGTYAITPSGDTTMRTYDAYEVKDGKIVTQPPLRVPESR